jgi:NAD(P)-dependent dehydrogenase (short-subunit alcohol dehydrogenase family)
MFDIGCRVILHGRSATMDPGIAAEFSDEGRLGYVAADFADPNNSRLVVDFAMHRFGGLDILVNNAAIQHFSGIGTHEPEVWASTLNTNVAAAACLMSRAAEVMISNDGGVIINIASSRAQRPGAGLAAYSASKAALVNLTRSAAAEFGKSNIRVNAISPGLIERPGLREAWPQGVAEFEKGAPLGRIGQPADIAAACLFLASPAASWITGIDLAVDGGITLVR